MRIAYVWNAVRQKNIGPITRMQWKLTMQKFAKETTILKASDTPESKV